MGAMFKKAEKRGAKFALILGEDELNKGVAQLKNLKTKEQSEISLKIWAKNSTKPSISLSQRGRRRWLRD
jgi:histidyl-tRNA synthetase